MKLKPSVITNLTTTPPRSQSRARASSITNFVAPARVNQEPETIDPPVDIKPDDHDPAPEVRAEPMEVLAESSGDEPPAAQSGVLAPGDEIQVDVFREPDFSGTFILDDQVSFRHPLLGMVDLTGLDLLGAEQRIHDLLAADFIVEPRVMLKLNREQASLKVVIFGEVKSPGIYPVPPDGNITLLELIGLAGGFTELASPDRVRVVRKQDGETENLRVRVQEMLSGKGRQTDVTLQPDDVVVVPQIMF